MRSLSFVSVAAALSSVSATIVFWDGPGCNGMPSILPNFPVNTCDPFEWRRFGSYTGSANPPVEEVLGYYNLGDCVTRSSSNVTFRSNEPTICHNIPVDKITEVGAFRRVVLVELQTQ